MWVISVVFQCARSYTADKQSPSNSLFPITYSMSCVLRIKKLYHVDHRIPFTQRHVKCFPALIFLSYLHCHSSTFTRSWGAGRSYNVASAVAFKYVQLIKYSMCTMMGFCNFILLFTILSYSFFTIPAESSGCSPKPSTVTTLDMDRVIIIIIIKILFSILQS